MDAAEPIGRRIIRLAESVSTNDDAKRAAEVGCAEGAVFVAERQTGGRGRQGRVWVSPPGLGLYCSIVLRPGWPADEAPWLGVLAGLAVLHAVHDLGLPAARLKWPNDVLVDGRKLAGVLVEPRLAAGCIDFAVIGIGLNLAHEDADWPPPLAQSAVSLRQLGRGVSADAALAAICRSLQQAYDRVKAAGVASLSGAWEDACGRADLPRMA